MEMVISMSEKELLKLIKEGESETTELKLKVDEELGKVICVFANSKGGVILVGVNNG